MTVSPMGTRGERTNITTSLPLSAGVPAGSEADILLPGCHGAGELFPVAVIWQVSVADMPDSN